MPPLIARSGLPFSDIHSFKAQAVDIDPTPEIRRHISKSPDKTLPEIVLFPLIFSKAAAS